MKLWAECRRPALMLPARSGAIDAFAAENDWRFTGAVGISTDQEATDGMTFLVLEVKGHPEQAVTSAITTKSGRASSTE
jgi:hypothetical protein